MSSLQSFQIALFSGLCVFLLRGGRLHKLRAAAGVPRFIRCWSGSACWETLGMPDLWSNQEPSLWGSSFVLPGGWEASSSELTTPFSHDLPLSQFQICFGATGAKPDRQYKFASLRIGSKAQCQVGKSQLGTRRGVKRVQTSRSPSLLLVLCGRLKKEPLVNHWVIYRLILAQPLK